MILQDNRIYCAYFLSYDSMKRKPRGLWAFDIIMRIECSA